MARDWYGKTERIDEYACDEVNVVESLSGEGGYWSRYKHGCLDQCKTLFWQTDQSQKFVVLFVLCELPCQNPRILFSNH